MPKKDSIDFDYVGRGYVANAPGAPETYHLGQVRYVRLDLYRELKSQIQSDQAANAERIATLESQLRCAELPATERSEEFSNLERELRNERGTVELASEVIQVAREKCANLEESSENLNAEILRLRAQLVQLEDEKYQSAGDSGQQQEEIIQLRDELERSSRVASYATQMVRNRDATIDKQKNQLEAATAEIEHLRKEVNDSQQTAPGNSGSDSEQSAVPEHGHPSAPDKIYVPFTLSGAQELLRQHVVAAAGGDDSPQAREAAKALLTSIVVYGVFETHKQRDDSTRGACACAADSPEAGSPSPGTFSLSAEVIDAAAKASYEHGSGVNDGRWDAARSSWKEDERRLVEDIIAAVAPALRKQGVTACKNRAKLICAHQLGIDHPLVSAIERIAKPNAATGLYE